MRRSVADLQRIRNNGGPGAGASDPTAPATLGEGAEADNVALVHRVLTHLRKHYQEPSLSLSGIAAAVGCNPRYVTSRFTTIVGEHMHNYLNGLRAAHACGLLMTTELLVKEVAYASGFRGPRPMVRAFRRQVGVSPRDYRRMFVGP